MKLDELKETISKKKILFVSTKNKDYLRNVQEINFLDQYGEFCEVLAYSDKSYLKRLIKIYIKLLPKLFSKKYDYFFVGFAPQLIFPYFLFLKREKLIIDFFISFYDTLVDDRKKIKATSFVAKILKKIDRYVIAKAKIVVVDTKADRDYFVKEFDSTTDKFIVWYIEADTAIFTPALYEKKQMDRFEIVYFGSILPLQGVEVILEATRKLKHQTDIHFTIIGPINSNLNIKEAEYTNVTFIPWLSQPELANAIQQADLCLAGHFNGEIGKADRTIAGKTYIFKAMEKPVILGDSQANREKFTENEENYYVPRGNPEALSQKIEEIFLAVKKEKVHG